MHLVDLFNLVSELIRRGPEQIAAFLVGIAVGGGVVLYMWWHFRKRSEASDAKRNDTIQRLTEQMEHLTDSNFDLTTKNMSLQDNTEANQAQLAGALEES
jgi:hypothetical protein